MRKDYLENINILIESYAFEKQEFRDTQLKIEQYKLNIESTRRVLVEKVGCISEGELNLYRSKEKKVELEKIYQKAKWKKN